MQVSITLIPKLELYTITTQNTGKELTVNNKRSDKQKYYKLDEHDFGCKKYYQFPIIIDADCSLWVLGNLFLLSKIKSFNPSPSSTLKVIAYDLKKFRQWCLNNEVDYLFDEPKIFIRPLFKYSRYLKNKIESGGLSSNTAKRQATTIISFYQWLINELHFKFSYSPFGECKFRKIHYENQQGGLLSKSISTTDIHQMFNSAQASKISQEYIIDGGKLTPLTTDDQSILINSLKRINNPEMILIFLLSLTSGARKQSILTMPNNVFTEDAQCIDKYFPISIGPGTNIDTKRDKRHVIHVPEIIFNMVRVYLKSERYRKRLSESHYKNDSELDKYVFLTQSSNPYYHRKNDRHKSKYRSLKNGESVNTFMSQQLFPNIQKNGNKLFFRFHDLRATYGVNLARSAFSENGINLSNIKGEKYYYALNLISQRMGHSNRTTTESYLRWDKKKNIYMEIQDEYEKLLNKIGAINEMD